MTKRLRVLLVEDSRDDADLLLRAMRRHDYEIEHERVQTAGEMRAALDGSTWDLVLSDYSMPTFSAPQALDVLKSRGIEIPFIIVSGTIGEETAVDALKAGADDFLVKGRLARLWPAIERGLREAETRRQRRDAEEALRQSEQRFRSLVESMNDIVFSLDCDMHYDALFGKRLALEEFGKEYAIGQTPHDMNVHESALARALGGESTTYEWSRTEHGQVRHFQNSLAPRRDGDGRVTGVVGVNRDITEGKRMQAQLATADRMASVGVLAAGVGHEINSPLAALVANIDVALQDARLIESNAKTHEELKELLAELTDARDAALRIRDIVHDLKLFSRESEKSGPVDVNQVLESSLRMAGNEIRHRARLIKELEAVPPVEANESRLGQVFLNLLTNAAQAIGEGRAQDNAIRVVSRRSSDGEVTIEVHDTGCGIDPADFGRLFTPFFTTKPVGVGTGLGLAICHRIVTSFGGRIAVDSRPGRGSTFRVSFPPSSGAIKSTLPSSERVPKSARRGRVLVVDDDRMVTQAIRRSLRDAHDVETVTDARVALERLKGGEPFDVILCDLMMPEMSGMDLYGELEKSAPQQAKRVVFLTGGAFTKRAREFLESVDNDCIEKPFDLAELRALIGDRVR
jgi:signal transduction histidine kinase